MLEWVRRNTADGEFCADKVTILFVVAVVVGGGGGFCYCYCVLNSHLGEYIAEGEFCVDKSPIISTHN